MTSVNNLGQIPKVALRSRKKRKPRKSKSEQLIDLVQDLADSPDQSVEGRDSLSAHDSEQDELHTVVI
jgi:hypothetical protein